MIQYILSRPAAGVPRAGGASCWWCHGSGQQGSGGRQSWATIPFSSMSRYMYFRQSKPKFLSPNSFSTMAVITPTTSPSENLTCYAP